jgi:hypothetical protein
VQVLELQQPVHTIINPFSVPNTVPLTEHRCLVVPVLPHPRQPPGGGARPVDELANGGTIADVLF